ncbi:MAG: transcriptional repressor [Clostridia bacterium]|nr:transcriptional repressor [Clostridia bacterium]
MPNKTNKAYGPSKKERNTRQKETVRAAFCGMRNHPTAQMVYEEAVKLDRSIGRATVYRILNSFVESGAAVRVPVSDGADRFDITLTPHAHARCRVCGAVFDVELCGEMPKAKETGRFEIESCAVLFSGLCRECKKVKNA